MGGPARFRLGRRTDGSGPPADVDRAGQHHLLSAPRYRQRAAQGRRAVHWRPQQEVFRGVVDRRQHPAQGNRHGPAPRRGDLHGYPLGVVGTKVHLAPGVPDRLPRRSVRRQGRQGQMGRQDGRQVHRPAHHRHARRLHARNVCGRHRQSEPPDFTADDDVRGEGLDGNRPRPIPQDALPCDQECAKGRLACAPRQRYQPGHLSRPDRRALPGPGTAFDGDGCLESGGDRLRKLPVPAEARRGAGIRRGAAGKHRRRLRQRNGADHRRAKSAGTSDGGGPRHRRPGARRGTARN